MVKLRKLPRILIKSVQIEVKEVQIFFIVERFVFLQV